LVSLYSVQDAWWKRLGAILLQNIVKSGSDRVQLFYLFMRNVSIRKCASVQWYCRGHPRSQSGTGRDPLIAVHRTGSGIVISSGLPECLEKVSQAILGLSTRSFPITLILQGSFESTYWSVLYKPFNTDYFVGNKPEHGPAGHSGGYSSGSGDPL
jgi:hypothetical protein